MLKDKSLCSGCGACASECPRSCIEMCPDAHGFLYPQINQERCVDCGRCQAVCPITEDGCEKPASNTAAYSVCSNSDDVRLSSSSGGAFTLLAEYVISMGGVVFGACFDENWDVIHASAETREELRKFRGAKYVQSRIGDTYLQAKRFLQAGRIVLFSGTPCQIGGLKAFLKKDYDNLICQDLICHGVPAPGIWKKYLQQRQSKAGAPIKDISFRCKKHGWKSYSLFMSFENGKEYVQSPALDPFMRSFLSDLSLRRSCFSCAFKGDTRQADITLADFWGIQHVMPQMDDDKGTSLVLVHTGKGERLMKEISGNAKIMPTDINAALEYNPSARVSAKMPQNYDLFFEAVEASASFERVVDKFCRIPYVLKMKLRIYQKLKIWGIIGD